MKSQTTLLSLAAVLILVGCASQTPEERAQNYIDKGDAKMEQAVELLYTADDDYFVNDDKGATKAFNKAIGYIDDAIVYYAKAVTGPDQKKAVASLDDGLGQMKSCVEALERDDVEKAQAHYDSAQDYFDSASNYLWASN